VEIETVLAILQMPARDPIYQAGRNVQSETDCGGAFFGTAR